MTRRNSLGSLAVLLLLACTALPSGPAAGADGQMTWAAHISLAPTWLDPAETPGIVTPFIHAPGPRVAESGLGLITGWAFSAPHEDVRLKPR